MCGKPMNATEADGFFSSVLDSLTQHIAVIDADGTIQWVNRSWKSFAEANGGTPDKAWPGTNYLHVCGNSAEEGEADGGDALAGIKAVISGEQPLFYFEYPCHSPTEQRWFMMGACPLGWDGPEHFVITHQDITERKRAELRVQELAVLDAVTGIANRRRFDDELQSEWRRARRSGQPVSLALFDIDFFKLYNDTYGHIAGDECLKRVGEAMVNVCRRPGDLAARYGGEEFAIILGDTEHEVARDLAEGIRASIQALDIPHERAIPAGCITVSVGVATARPDGDAHAVPFRLIEAADRALYEAKASGRNCVR